MEPIKIPLCAVPLVAGILLCGGLSAAPPVTFNKHIAPLLFQRCAGCHRPGQVAPFSLLTYDDAAKRGEHLVEVVSRGAMPPWKPLDLPGTFDGERRMSSDDIELLRQWAAAGAPEGVAADLPSAPKFRDGWQLGEPDLVLTVPEPISVPAAGRDLHLNIVLPLKVPPGKFLKAAEFRPGNPRVVHHAILYMDTTGEARKRDRGYAGQGFPALTPPGAYLPGSLGIWTTGRNAMPLPDDIAMFWPPNADLVLNLHLHPTGKPETEQSSIGFYLVDDPPERLIMPITLTDMEINIPPGDKAYATHDRKVIPVDSDLLTILPHMHALGRQMKVTAHLPDGQVLPLLEIGDWDYNWQELYQYSKPIRLPKGTVVALNAIHDNSADNPQNPRNPPVRVRGGEAAEDEMSLAFLCVSPVAAAKAPQGGGGQFDPAAQHGTALWRQADADADGRLSLAELMAAMGGTVGRDEIEQIVRRFDRDGDACLNLAEFLAARKAMGN